MTKYPKTGAEQVKIKVGPPSIYLVQSTETLPKRYWFLKNNIIFFEIVHQNPTKSGVVFSGIFPTVSPPPHLRYIILKMLIFFFYLTSVEIEKICLKKLFPLSVSQFFRVCITHFFLNYLVSFLPKIAYIGGNRQTKKIS